MTPAFRWAAMTARGIHSRTAHKMGQSSSFVGLIVLGRTETVSAHNSETRPSLNVGPFSGDGLVR